MPAQKSVRHKIARRKKSAEYQKPHFLFGRILFLVILVVLLWFSWQLVDSFRNRVYTRGTRITFVVAERDPIVYSLSPGGELLTFKIPGNTQIETAGGYGTFLASSLWGLSQQKGKGGELLRLSIQRFLGIPVDAWIGEGGGELFSPHALRRIAVFKEASNLTFFDRLSLFVDVSNVNSADRNSLDLETSRVLKIEKFLDGVEGFVVVPEQAKLFFDALRDEKVVEEGETLIVVNATSQQGLALRVADVAGALGIRVVAVETERASRSGSLCIIKGESEDLQSLSARRLSQIFQCAREDGEARGGAKLEIILGDDFVNTF